MSPVSRRTGKKYATGSEMSKAGYEGLRCAVCGQSVPLSGPAFQGETDAKGVARIWHTKCGRPPA